MRSTKLPKKRRGQWVRPEITRLLQRREINPRQAMVLATISNLSKVNNGEGCYAGNTFLAKTTTCTVSGVRKILTRSRKLGVLIDKVMCSKGTRTLNCHFGKVSKEVRAQRKRKYHSIWICPKLMRLLERRIINHTQMFLLAIIDNLDKHTSRAGCFASNKYLAKRIGVSQDHVVHILMDLCKIGLLSSTTDHGKTRLLKCNFGTRKPQVIDDHLSNSHVHNLPQGKRAKQREKGSLKTTSGDVLLSQGKRKKHTKSGCDRSTSPNVLLSQGGRASVAPYNKEDNKAKNRVPKGTRLREHNKLCSRGFHGGSPCEPLVQTGGEESQLSYLGNTTPYQSTLSKAFTLNTTNPKDKRSVPIREIDKQRAKRFHTIVRQHNILPKLVKVRPASWYKWMFKIAAKFGGEYLDRVLNHLEKHGADKYCPKPRTAMHLYRSIQEGAFDTAFAREKERNPTVTISEDAKRIAHRLHNNIWPDGTEERIPAAVQLSLNNLKEWRALLKQVPLERSERDLADHVLNTIHFDNELVAVWFEELFNRIWNWPDWHGDPLREVLDPFDTDPRNRFTRQCRQVAHEYTSNNGGARWVAILEAVKDARQQV